MYGRDSPTQRQSVTRMDRSFVRCSFVCSAAFASRRPDLLSIELRATNDRRPHGHSRLREFMSVHESRVQESRVASLESRVTNSRFTHRHESHAEVAERSIEACPCACRQACTEQHQRKLPGGLCERDVDSGSTNGPIDSGKHPVEWQCMCGKICSLKMRLSCFVYAWCWAQQ